MIHLEIEKILVLAPHTDDAELGAGGLIHKLIKKNKIVNIAVFSKPPAPGMDDGDETLKHEMYDSLSSLGVNEQNITLFNYQHRIFESHRQEICDAMIMLRETLKPDLIITPSSCDQHQDHQVIHNEAKRAFKGHSIIGYDLPWNSKNFSCDIFQRLSRQDVNAKIRCLQKYKSQSSRLYFKNDYIECLAKVRGGMIGAEFAECFESIRLTLQ